MYFCFRSSQIQYRIARSLSDRILDMYRPFESRQKIARPCFGHSLTNFHLPTAVASYQTPSDNSFILNTNMWTALRSLRYPYHFSSSVVSKLPQYTFGNTPLPTSANLTECHIGRRTGRRVPSSGTLRRPVVGVLFGFLICSRFSLFLTCSLCGENWRPI